MKLWLYKIKKAGTLCISIATLGLPLLLLISYLIGMSEAYSNLKNMLPIHPYTALLATALPYLAVLGLAIYQFKKKRRLGELRLLGVVFSALTFAILIQAGLSLYIVSYR